MNPSKRPQGPARKSGAASSVAKKRNAAAMLTTQAVPGKAPWRPIGQRRLLTMLERAITHSLRWAVFEVNDETLWVRVRATLEHVLINEWKNGNLRGDTAEQAFFVRCDRSTMTEYDIANARFVVQVGLACAKPSEFIVLRVAQSTAG